MPCTRISRSIRISKLRFGTFYQWKETTSAGGILSNPVTSPLVQSREKKTVKLHLGCGMISPVGWINVDGSWNARVAKYPFLRKMLVATSIISKDQSNVPWDPNIVTQDLRKPLPFPANSLEAIYASHLLEHLYLDEARQLLSECFRTLQPRGVLRMVVPDLQWAAREYLKSLESYDFRDSKAPTPADWLNSRLLLREPSSARGNVLYKLYKNLKDFHSHKWMYDAPSLCAEFSKIGLAEVSEKSLHDSRIAGIEEVEDQNRVVNGQGICVEGVKPVSFSR
jgi:predicted SAM-dependent methyltransferase